MREKIPYGSNILVKEKKVKLKEDKKIAEWDPYTRPIITEKKGFVRFVDLNKDTLEETTSQDTGMTSQVIKDWRIPGGGKAIKL